MQMKEADVLARLKPLLEDDSVLKIAQNLKYDFLIFLQRGIRVAPFDDTMLISYVLEGGLHGHGMDELSQLHLSAHARSRSAKSPARARTRSPSIACRSRTRRAIRPRMPTSRCGFICC